MKANLHLNSQEETIINIVELVSKLSINTIRGKSRKPNIAIARSILSNMLRQEGCTATRSSILVGRHHCSALKYTKDHKDNLEFYPQYRDMYLAVQDEYKTGYRALRIDIMQDQITHLQEQITILKKNTNKLINK